MPWFTPTLKDTRRLTRDYVLSQLGAKAMIPNSVLRIMSDAMSGLTHLTFLYLDWLAKQLMPDTAETEWLDRHGTIWLTNADGSKGRKTATYATGSVLFTGSVPGTVIPIGSLLTAGTTAQYQTTTQGFIDLAGFATADAICLVAGATGNLPDGLSVSLVNQINGVTGATLDGNMQGGSDEETDDALRERVLLRIQQPPMGGDIEDYVQWALAVPGVTRAWAAQEMGIGTITVRFLMDDTYPDNYGLPTGEDVATVAAYIDSQRPVTVKDCWVMAPVMYFYTVGVPNLTVDNPTVRGNIEASIKAMERVRSKPGQTMYRSWVDEAISQAVGENTHELNFETIEMPEPGYMPAMGTIIFDD